MTHLSHISPALCEILDVLARIRESARHTNQIVDEMLMIARHEAG